MNKKLKNETVETTEQDTRADKIKTVLALVEELRDSETGFCPLIVLNGYNELEFTFKKSGRAFTHKLGELPEASISALLNYGTRKGNDRVNSRFGKDKDGKLIQEDTPENRAKEVNAFHVALLDGTLDKRDSLGNPELREYVIRRLVERGRAKKEFNGVKLSAIFADLAEKNGKTAEDMEAAFVKMYEADKALHEKDDFTV